MTFEFQPGMMYVVLQVNSSGPTLGSFSEVILLTEGHHLAVVPSVDVLIIFFGPSETL